MMSTIHYIRELYVSPSVKKTTVLEDPSLLDRVPYTTDFIRFSFSSGSFVVGRDKPCPEYAVSSNRATGYYFHYVVSGEGSYNGQPFGPGDMFVTKPNEQKQLLPTPSKTWELYWCSWKGARAEAVSGALKQFKSNTIYHIPRIASIRTLFDYLIYNTHQENQAETIVTAFSELIIAEFKQCLEPKGRARKHADTIAAIKAYINEEFCTVNVEDLARKFHFDRKYLSYIFREATGTTIQNYIQKAKIRYATNLLMTDRVPISELALPAGYKTYHSFLKAFKKEYHLTPSEFLKANLE